MYAPVLNKRRIMSKEGINSFKAPIQTFEDKCQMMSKCQVIDRVKMMGQTFVETMPINIFCELNVAFAQCQMV